MKHLQKVQATEEQPPKSDLWLNKKEGTLKEFTKGEWKEISGGSGSGDGIVEEYVKNLSSDFKFYYCSDTEVSLSSRFHTFSDSYFQDHGPSEAQVEDRSVRIANGISFHWHSIHFGADGGDPTNLFAADKITAKIGYIDENGDWDELPIDETSLNDFFAPFEVTKEIFMQKIKEIVHV